jgi:ABC-type sugar transport system substrate-binding protein
MQIANTQVIMRLNPVAPSQWEEFKTAAPLLGLEAQLLDVRKPEDVVRAFDTAIAQRADAILVGNDSSR